MTVELRVAPDADALLAREAAAARLREEAEAISAASARVVEKLVRENGALVERIERFQAERAPVPRGRREGAGEEEEEEEEVSRAFRDWVRVRLEGEKRKNAREPAAPAAISVAAPEEKREPRRRAVCGRSSPAPTARRRSTSRDDRTHPWRAAGRDERGERRCSNRTPQGSQIDDEKSSLRS